MKNSRILNSDLRAEPHQGLDPITHQPATHFRIRRGQDQVDAVAGALRLNIPEEASCSINDKSPGQRRAESRNQREYAGGRLGVSTFFGAAISQTTIQQPLGIGAFARSVWRYWT
jgi:hypothetical protein